METTRSRFTGHGSKLIISLRRGKRGVNVSATVRVPGEKSQTGMRSTHQKEDTARAEFDKLVAAAAQRGWSPQTVGTFTEIPAPVAPDPAKAKAKKVARA